MVLALAGRLAIMIHPRLGQKYVVRTSTHARKGGRGPHVHVKPGCEEPQQDADESHLHPPWRQERTRDPRPKLMKRKIGENQTQDVIPASPA